MPNKVYAAPGTVLTIQSSGGDAVITPTSVSNGAGRISARLDRGAGSVPALYRWHCHFKTGASATVGRTLRLYLICSDSATGSAGTDGTFSESDQGVSSEDLLLNGQPISPVRVDQATTGPFNSSGLLEIRARYVQVAFWNDSAQAMSSTPADFAFTLTPEPDEIQ